MAGMKVTDRTEVEPAIEKALQHPGPVLIDFQVEQEEDIYPMVPPGAALSETIDQPEVEEETKPKKVRPS
jgi:acetolactate synthase-1/2/3 large subunit